MENCIEETVLRFKYPYGCTDEAKALERLLDKKSVKFIFYESDGYWDHEFVVRKSGYTWKDVMSMVNSIKPAKYKKEKTWFNQDMDEIVFCN